MERLAAASFDDGQPGSEHKAGFAMTGNSSHVTVRPEVFEATEQILQQARVANALRIRPTCSCDGCVTHRSTDEQQTDIDTVGCPKSSGESE